MSPELKERIYQEILREMIWGGDQEKIFRKLEVNRITGEEAQELYDRARKERVALIRSQAVQKALRGLGFLLLGGVPHVILWYGPRDFGVTFQIFWVLIIWGAWWLSTGTLEALLAAKKTSAIEEDPD